MINYSKQLEKEMLQQLSEAAQQSTDERVRINRSIQVTNTIMQQLKEYTLNYKFQSPAEEIHFFKRIKPSFQKHALFWVELAAIENNNYAITNKDTIEYYKNTMDNLKGFFSKGINQLFYLYYKQNHNHQDDQMFLRATDCTPLEPEYTLDFDDRFCTVNSSKFARFEAYEMIIDYLLTRINALKNKPASETSQPKDLPYLFWSDGDAAMAELGRGLKVSGSINNGQASLKDIMTVLQYMFNKQIGDYYRMYQDFLLRKKDLTPYFNRVTDRLASQIKTDAER